MGVLILLLMALRILTINCKGLNLSSKRVRLFNYIKNNYIDIIYAAYRKLSLLAALSLRLGICSGEGNLFGHMEVIGVEG